MHPTISRHITGFGFVALVLTIGLIGASRLESDLARDAAPLVASAR